MLGIGEIAVILFIALIFIGPKKLPGLARGLGKGIREFQNAARGITDTINEPVQNIKNQVSETKDQIMSNQSTGTMDQPQVNAQIDDEFGDVSPDHNSDSKNS